MDHLSEEQAEALEEYLTKNLKACPQCSGTEWTPRELSVTAADVVLGNQPAEVGSRAFVKLTCDACGQEDAIDCAEAGLPGY